MDVCSIGGAEAAELVVEYHYLHRKPQIMHAYGLRTSLFDPIAGVITFGRPASRSVQISACRSDPSVVIELNRMWIDDSQPKNTATWFMSRALKLLPASIVISYADTAHGHMGYVYRAANFRYAGWTEMHCKKRRYNRVPLDATKGHWRHKFQIENSTKVYRNPKVRYWTVTGNRQEKRELEKQCTWPSLSWGDLPPPREHRHVNEVIVEQGMKALGL